jgi:uncharacterized UBP type Zn finger protein
VNSSNLKLAASLMVTNLFNSEVLLDVQMTDEQRKDLEASEALAMQLLEEEKKNEEQEVSESVSGYVNQEYARQLMEMGFTKEVAEKALFFTLAQGGTTEKALEWIEQHGEDPDFLEELKIVG